MKFKKMVLLATISSIGMAYSLSSLGATTVYPKDVEGTYCNQAQYGSASIQILNFNSIGSADAHLSQDINDSTSCPNLGTYSKGSFSITNVDKQIYTLQGPGGCSVSGNYTVTNGEFTGFTINSSSGGCMAGTYTRQSTN